MYQYLTKEQLVNSPSNLVPRDYSLAWGKRPWERDWSPSGGELSLAYVAAFLQTCLFLDFFSRETDQSRSTWARISNEQMVSSGEHVDLIFRWSDDVSWKLIPCLWLVTKVPEWVWIRGKYNLN